MPSAPPLGIMPRWRWLELHPEPTEAQRAQRAQELDAAIERYQRVGIAIPTEWQDEQERRP